MLYYFFLKFLSSGSIRNGQMLPLDPDQIGNLQSNPFRYAFSPPGFTFLYQHIHCSMFYRVFLPYRFFFIFFVIPRSHFIVHSSIFTTHILVYVLLRLSWGWSSLQLSWGGRRSGGFIPPPPKPAPVKLPNWLTGQSHVQKKLNLCFKQCCGSGSEGSVSFCRIRNILLRIRIQIWT